MNKLAVVTGSTKGIGKAIVEKFAQNGFDIVANARNEADLKALQTNIQTQYPQVQLHYQATDMAVKEQVVRFANYVKSLQQPIEVLVNNAGVFMPGQIHNEEEGILETMINTNLYSAYHLTRSLMPELLAQKSGYVFNMCSVASVTAYPNGGSYSISKFALYGMNKVLREEMKDKNIRVTAILPGATLTPSWDGVDLPEERFIKAQDVAETVFSAYSMSPSAVVEEILIRPQLGDI